MTEKEFRNQLGSKLLNDRFLSDLTIIQMRRIVDDVVELVREIELIEVEHGVNCSDSCCTKMEENGDWRTFGF